MGEHDFASFANKGNPSVCKLTGAPLPLLSTVRRVRAVTIHDEVRVGLGLGLGIGLGIGLGLGLGLG